MKCRIKKIVLFACTAILWVQMNDFEMNGKEITLRNNENNENRLQFCRRLYFESSDNLIVHTEDRFSDFRKLEFLALLESSKTSTLTNLQKLDISL